MATNEQIGDVSALESCIGKTPGPMHLKVIDHLDAGAVRWLAASSLMFAGFASSDGVAVSLGGGRAGFAEVVDPSRVRVPTAMLDDPAVAREGQGVGTLFLIPTIGETLRINGRVASVDRDAVGIDVEECYIHCAKALIRSEFWKPDAHTAPFPEPEAYLAACRFIALATGDAASRADLSPKGDPAGAMIRPSGNAVWFADRPGNRRADSFRNMLSQPRVAVAALMPGTTRIAFVSGRAELTTDADIRASFAVQGKTPLMATRIVQPQIVLRDSPALERARPWPARAPAEAIDPAAIIAGHVRLSRERGLQATLVRTAVSVPGLMRRGLERDYKTNLY
ncbi:MAG: pyridoxamine 5'-phosphate oxidase family protein [Hyphomicrobiaceae bacterium]